MTPVNTQVIPLPLHTCSSRTHTHLCVSPARAARSRLLWRSPLFSPRCPGGQGKPPPSYGCQPASLPKSKWLQLDKQKGSRAARRCNKQAPSAGDLYPLPSRPSAAATTAPSDVTPRPPLPWRPRTPREVARATKVLRVWPPHVQRLAGQLLPGRVENSWKQSPFLRREHCFKDFQAGR